MGDMAWLHVFLLSPSRHTTVHISVHVCIITEHHTSTTSSERPRTDLHSAPNMIQDLFHSRTVRSELCYLFILLVGFNSQWVKIYSSDLTIGRYEIWGLKLT